MFARAAITAGKALRVGAVRGLMVPAARSLPRAIAASAFANGRSFSNLADVLASVNK